MRIPFELSRRGLLQGASCAGVLAALPPAIVFAQTPVADVPAPGSRFRWPLRPLLRETPEYSLAFKSLSKPVHRKLIIDDMEKAIGWQASAPANMSYTKDRAKAGTRSLRIHVNQRDEAYIRATRAKNGSFTGGAQLFDTPPYAASLHLKFAQPQDWSAYNRISLWCFVHPTQMGVTPLAFSFTSEGGNKRLYDPVAIHYIQDLKPGEWNLLTWEIPEYQRDKITEFSIFALTQGLTSPMKDTYLTYDFDQFALEVVDVEPPEGWAVTPGKLAFSHIGYQVGAPKIAITSETGARSFSLADETGAVRFEAPVRAEKTLRGEFGVLDFTAFTTPGRYTLRCGGGESGKFPIGEDVWRSLTEKTLNAYYGLRCGFEVPGFHAVCHADATATYNGETRLLCGGWHDAGNMTQHAGNTHHATYALLQFYHHASTRATDKALADRVLEEALWGLEWSLRVRFGPGMRCNFAQMSYFTDGIPGNFDDVVQVNVANEPAQNVVAALACASGARAFATKNPEFSKLLLTAAKEDYDAVARTITAPPAVAASIGMNRGSWRDQSGYIALTATELYRATGDKKYLDDAVKFAAWLLDLQEQRFVDGAPIAGYFHEDAAKKRLVHEFHNGNEESGLLPLAALCELLPDHPDWMKWYAGLLIHSEYFCLAGAGASAPFDIVPAAVWRRQDLLDTSADRVRDGGPTPEAAVQQKTVQFNAGVKLSEDRRLRVFPLNNDQLRHGATCVQLAKSAALSAAARTRGKGALSTLAARQLQWNLGANPFSRSLFYGEGYDYWQNFTGSVPNLVGGLSLGMNSYHGDSPAWPNNAVYPYKEIWIFSICRAMLNLASVGMPARLRGAAPAGAAFTHAVTKKVTRVGVGAFDVTLPSGDYDVVFGDAKRRLTLVDADDRTLSFDPAHWIDLSITVAAQPGGALTAHLSATGAGKHDVMLRLFNASAKSPKARFNLARGKTQTVDFGLQALDSEKAWIVVAAPQSNLSDRVEAFGVARTLNAFG